MSHLRVIIKGKPRSMLCLGSLSAHMDFRSWRNLRHFGLGRIDSNTRRIPDQFLFYEYLVPIKAGKSKSRQEAFSVSPAVTALSLWHPILPPISTVSIIIIPSNPFIVNYPTVRYYTQFSILVFVVFCPTGKDLPYGCRSLHWRARDNGLAHLVPLYA